VERTVSYRSYPYTRKIVTSGSATTISFSSIPAGYTNLRLTLRARDTNSGGANYVGYLKVNGDATAGNYTSVSYHRSGAAGVDEAQFRASGNWLSVSPINALVVTAGGTAFVDGAEALLELT
jgi:hypothetical protein